MEESGPRVLVIDDEKAIRRFLRASLTAHGYTVFEAAGGQEGLNAVVANRPDLIILDLGLPDMDGIEVTRQLREWTRIPIIILSAIAEKTFLHSIKMLSPRQGSQLPEPEAYMEKPPDANELSRIIEELLPVDP